MQEQTKQIYCLATVVTYLTECMYNIQHQSAETITLPRSKYFGSFVFPLLGQTLRIGVRFVSCRSWIVS